MKNVSLTTYQRHGIDIYALIDPNGNRIKEFDHFLHLCSQEAPSTIKNYSHWMARFFDFFIDASLIKLNETSNANLTNSQLLEVLQAYPEYLMFGSESGNELAKAVSAINPVNKLKIGTVNAMLAPLRKYLEMSEEIRSQNEQKTVNDGNKLNKVSTVSMYSPTLVKPKPGQIHAMIMNSMMASVIAGGPKMVHVAMLPLRGKGVDSGSDGLEKAFPLDLIMGLINSFTTHRDKALCALIAASGCREHEALQILWSDLNFKERSVKLVDPKSRINTYKLEPKEREKLAWKSRKTESTLLIEPFAEEFWKNLEKYQKEEWKASANHSFVFLSLKKESLSRPYFLTSSSSRSKIFRNALGRLYKSTGDDRIRGLNNVGMHSLRHAYGVFLLNYLPLKDGKFGLPVSLVKQLMGHSSIKSTEIYAIHDTKLYEADIRYSSERSMNKENSLNVNQMRREVLLERLKHVETIISSENSGGGKK